MFTKTVQALTKAVDVENRTVEQIVSVFENVDLGGDRVKFGAFADTLQEWNDTEDVLSAYFSHQWENPFANVGGVIASEELAPGDERIPDKQVPMGDGTTKSLRELGGLLVKYQFDPEGENAFGDQVFRLLAKRRITQASFAYDITEAKRNSDGTRDLVKLKLLEVGPTLLGMNPATTLLTASRKGIEALAGETGLTADQVTNVLAAAAKNTTHTFIANDDGKCMLCGKGRTAVAHINQASSEDAEKKTVTFTGSVEERQSALSGLVTDWAKENDVANGDFYGCYLVATFDDHAVFMVEGWSDPMGEGKYFEVEVSEADGVVSIGEPVEVVIEQSTRPKAFLSLVAKAQKSRNTAKRKDATTVANEDEDETTEGANPEAGDGNGEGDEPEVESESEDEDDEEENDPKALRDQFDKLLLDAL